MGTQVEVQGCWTVANRNFVTARVLAGVMNETTGVLFMRSETRHDEWCVAKLHDNDFALPPEERRRRRESDECVLYFKPFDGIRDFAPGEIFTTTEET